MKKLESPNTHNAHVHVCLRMHENANFASFGY